jgi:hypothetical protein
MHIQTNHVERKDALTSLAIYTIDTGVSDMSIQGDLTDDGADGEMYLLFRYRASGGTHFKAWIDAVANKLKVQETNGSTNPVHVDVAATINAGTAYTVKLAAHQNNFTVWLDDVEKGSFTSTWNQTETLVGIASDRDAGDGSTNGEIDALEAWTYLP